MLIKEMVQTRPLSHRPSQIAPVRVRHPDGVKRPTTQAPCHQVAHVKHPFATHPRENAVPQAIRTLRVLRIGRAIPRPRDFDNDAGPPSLDELVGSLGVVRPISIETCDQKHGGNTVLGTGVRRDTSIQRYYWFIGTRSSGVWDAFLDDGIDPAANSLCVGIFLRFPGPTFHVGVDDGET